LAPGRVRPGGVGGASPSLGGRAARPRGLHPVFFFACQSPPPVKGGGGGGSEEALPSAKAEKYFRSSLGTLKGCLTVLAAGAVLCFLWPASGGVFSRLPGHGSFVARPHNRGHTGGKPRAQNFCASSGGDWAGPTLGRGPQAQSKITHGGGKKQKGLESWFFRKTGAKKDGYEKGL